MTGRRYTAAERRRLTAVGERIRDDEGVSVPEVARRMDLPVKTAWRWLRSRHEARPARVGYDPEAGCWRIYVYDPAREDDPQRGIEWWALEWLRFASEDLAFAHLAANGEYEAA